MIEAWKLIYFWVKGQGHDHKNVAGVVLCTLVLASS